MQIIDNFKMMNSVRHAIADQIERYQKKIIEFELHQKYADQEGFVQASFGEIRPNDQPGMSSFHDQANKYRETLEALKQAYDNFAEIKDMMSKKSAQMAGQAIRERHFGKKANPVKEVNPEDKGAS